jgi:hypothetical protein
MKKSFLTILWAVLILLSAVSNAAEPWRATQTIEAEKLQIVLGDDLNGYVTGRICDQCKVLRTVITPDTRAFAGDVPVPLIKARDRASKTALVTFEEATLKVVTIHW